MKMMKSVVAFNEGKSDRITISLDLEKLRPENLPLVNFADVVIMSKEFAMDLGYENKTNAVHSFRALTRTGLVSSSVFHHCMTHFAHIFSSNIIICPWGTDGVAALDSNDKLFSAEAYPPDNVVDSLGAGDTFAAGVIFSLYQGRSIDFAIQFASRLAGLKVGFFGYDQICENFKKFL